jgi:hypothetical protein
MRTKLTLGLTALALIFGPGGVSAAPTELTVHGITMQSAAGSVQPPAGVELNQKGLTAIKPASGHFSASELTSNDLLSGTSEINKAATGNMVRRPDPLESELENNLLSGFSTAATRDMVNPPSK